MKLFVDKGREVGDTAVVFLWLPRFVKTAAGYDLVWLQKVRRTWVSYSSYLGDWEKEYAYVD